RTGPAQGVKHWPQSHPAGGSYLGVGRPEPGARVDRLAPLADLEIQLRTAAAAAVAGGGDAFTGRDRLAGRLVEPLVVAVQAQVPVPMVDDGDETEAREPVATHDRVLPDRFDRRPALGRPLHPA